MRSLDDYLTDIITRKIIFSPTDECFLAHGWMDTDFAMLMFFFEHEFLSKVGGPSKVFVMLCGMESQATTYL